MNARHWRRWLRIGQFCVTVGLVVWLLRQIAWSSLLPLFASMRWEFLVAGMGCLIVCHLINIVRWGYLLDQQPVGWSKLLVFYGAGLFSNNFLPTGIGGDGVRAILLGRVTTPGRAILSVVLDRGIGLVALSALLAAGIWAGIPTVLDLPVDGLHISLGTFRIIVVVVLGISMIILMTLVVWRLSPTVRSTALRLITELIERCDLPQWTKGEWSRRLAGGYLLSVFSHICIVVATACMLQAIWVTLPLSAILWLVILSSLSLLLPIAVNGIGVAEGVYVVVLISYGLPTSAGLGCALLMRMAAMLLSMVGGVALLQRRVPIIVDVTGSKLPA
jgi:glycosyltransferase 2 family protein